MALPKAIRPAFLLLIGGEIVFLAGIFVSACLSPEAISADQGLSVLGVCRESSLPFTLGLIGAGASVMVASLVLPRWRRLQVLRMLLGLSGLLAIGVALTPFTLSPFIGQLHKVIGSGLFGAQFILAVWLMIRTKPPLAAWFCLALLPLGAVGAIGTFPGGGGYSFYGQLIYQLAFAALVLLTLQRLRR